MRSGRPCAALLLIGFAGAAGPAFGQQLYFERLPQDYLAVTSPAERVSGAPGQMRVLETGCRNLPLDDARQRIVDIAVQEWAYFGFSIADETVERERGPTDGASDTNGQRRFRPGFTWLDLDESARLADSIAGYWAITGDGSWILNRQNDVWKGSGVGARWRDPWSAAFISWVMCESGMGDDTRFERAINHHTYIDQAIRARDGALADTAYVAFDVGEQRIEPGDLLCAARRPSLSSLDQRRRQLGHGIRSHCDIVIKVEPERGRILAIGGNVRGSVSLKLLPAEFSAAASNAGAGAAAGPSGGAGSASDVAVERVGRGRGEIFAHLKLRARPVADDPLRLSPTIRRIATEPDLFARLRATLERAVRSLSDSVLISG